MTVKVLIDALKVVPNKDLPVIIRGQLQDGEETEATFCGIVFIDDPELRRKLGKKSGVLVGI